MITINDLAMRYGAKILFKNVNLQLNSGCRYGLVGANGSGKSTFIQLITGEVTPEAGQISHQYTIGTLKQDHFAYENDCILTIVLKGHSTLWQAWEKQKQLLALPHFTEKETEQLADVEKIIAKEGGYAAESEAAKLLEGLGIIKDYHLKPLHVLSGGYKLRVLLAQLFFSQPATLVLDEPTNHLDLYSIQWLEDYLSTYKGSLIVSSHDRTFLNRVCTHILDVDYASIKAYPGNYDAFAVQKEQEYQQKELLLVKYDKRRQDIQGFIDRFGAKATKARQAKSKARMVEHLVDEIESIDLAPTSRKQPSLKFQCARSSGIHVLKVQQVSKSYGPKQVLHKVEFEIERGDRLAIVGPNGIGKSTLLEILTQHHRADEGSFTWGFATSISYFPQDHTREVQPGLSLLDWLRGVKPDLAEERLREVLARVLFSGDKVHQATHTLSGGETARLILAKMMLQEANVLIFDEPTNHLDIEAIDTLTAALQQFEETLIFVSHNRYFVGAVANRILEISLTGVKDFRCSYEEYQERQTTDYLAAQSKTRKESTDTAYEDQKKLRNRKTQLQKKVAQAEETCHEIEVELKKLDQILAQDGFFQNAPRTEQEHILNRKKKLEHDLDQALLEWEEAGAALADL